jgi:hypothetical protein
LAQENKTAFHLFDELAAFLPFGIFSSAVFVNNGRSTVKIAPLPSPPLAALIVPL